MAENNLVVLVVDDEPDDRQRMSESLEKEGYFVIQAANPTQALTTASQEQGRRIDLLVTDISLPGTNGCELAQRLLKRYPDLKVLFVSGYVGAEVCRYYGIPVTDLFFLRKPFQTDELLHRVQQVMASHERVPLRAWNGDAEPTQDSV